MATAVLNPKVGFWELILKHNLRTPSVQAADSFHEIGAKIQPGLLLKLNADSEVVQFLNPAAATR